eukprot:CAMPEP_0171098572 /NCGR_PEP_ID=MMETSP0766_2-20121228/48741_1 /TAXON_ID=439317 /ORGANISM="Gambierdiscus australes, Strain CAWD 149" /LENGTH=96 /DNA_ID=CAMNT_0011557947 /DNA_START=64 /DNA_END=354 /DNA_ORIENTATION=-
MPRPAVAGQRQSAKRSTASIAACRSSCADVAGTCTSATAACAAGGRGWGSLATASADPDKGGQRSSAGGRAQLNPGLENSGKSCCSVAMCSVSLAT